MRNEKDRDSHKKTLEKEGQLNNKRDKTSCLKITFLLLGVIAISFTFALGGETGLSAAWVGVCQEERDTLLLPDEFILFLLYTLYPYISGILRS